MKYLENEKMKEAGLFACDLEISYNFNFPAENENLIRDIEVKICGYDEKEEDQICLATAKILMVPSPWYGINCDEEEDMYDLMDAKSGDLATVAEILNIDNIEEMEDRIWEDILGGDLFYISEIIVNKKYRNLGIGSMLLKKLPEVLEDALNLGVGLMVLVASPLDISRDDKKKYAAAKKNLYGFYEKNGYDLIDKKEGVMVRNRAFEFES